MAVYQTVANMLVSICIPTCDRPLLLWEAILSCFAQSHRPLEVLIGDDSANDDSKSLAETIVSPQGVTLRYRRNRPRLGQAGNVNSLFDALAGIGSSCFTTTIRFCRALLACCWIVSTAIPRSSQPMVSNG